jgi:hypothetical protein
VSALVSIEGTDNFQEKYSPSIGVMVSRIVGTRVAAYVTPIWADNTAASLDAILERLRALEEMSSQTQILTRVGPASAADGTADNQARSTRELASVVGDIGGRFEEATFRNQVYSASTAVAGVAPGTALSTTPPFLLYNPSNSGKVLSLIETFVGYVSGTLGAGTIVYAAASVAQPNLPTGGTALAILTALLGGADSQSVAAALQAATVAATPRIFKPAFTLGAALATTPAFAALVKDQVNGAIEVLPGYFLAMQGIAAAGTAPLVLFGATWKELAI